MLSTMFFDFYFFCNFSKFLKSIRISQKTGLLFLHIVLKTPLHDPLPDLYRLYARFYSLLIFPYALKLAYVTADDNKGRNHLNGVCFVIFFECKKCKCQK